MELEPIRREAEAFVSRQIERARTPNVSRWRQLVGQVVGPIPPGVLLQLVASESGGNPNARSSHPEFGLLQLVQDEIDRYGVDWRDPVSNIYAAQASYADTIRRIGREGGSQPSDALFIAVLSRSIGPGATRFLLRASADLPGGTAAGRAVEYLRRLDADPTARAGWTGRQSLGLVARRVYTADYRIARAAEVGLGPAQLGPLDVPRPTGVRLRPFRRGALSRDVDRDPSRGGVDRK